MANNNEQVARVGNPFGDVEKAPAGEQSGMQRGVAEVQAQAVLAQQYPRDEKQCLENILNACTRNSLAQGAVYEYNKGGTDISGPSIMLLTAIAQHWGNVDAGVEETDRGEDSSSAKAYAWDLQTNVRFSIRFDVPHYRHTKNGTYKLTDPREIYEMVMNYGSRRMRKCLENIIPGDVVEKAVEQCEMTMKSEEDTSPEAMKKMCEAFKQYGVTKQHIEEFIQRKIDSITPAMKVRLRKIFTSLQEGASSPSDWFNISSSGAEESKEETDQRTQKVQERLQKKKQQDKQKQEASNAENQTAEETGQSENGVADEGSGDAQAESSESDTSASEETTTVQSSGKDQENAETKPPSRLGQEEAAQLIGVPSDIMMDYYFNVAGHATWASVPTGERKDIIANPEKVKTDINRWQEEQDSE